MGLFSQRVGLKPASKSLQRESLDEETRNALWSILWSLLQLSYKEDRSSYHGYRPFKSTLDELAASYWTDFFKKPIDTQPDFHKLEPILRDFFFRAPWNEALDLMEFTVKNVPESLSKSLRKEFNAALEKESSVYRFVDDLITELTTAAEIESIDSALEQSTAVVAAHIRKGLQFLADRKKPDYHNSIKESVSAIEAAAREATGNNSATLSDALKALGKQQALHPALIKMLMDLYGYAGDEGGVRHANKESGKPVSQAEARLILILAAATCGYLSAKKE